MKLIAISLLVASQGLADPREDEMFGEGSGSPAAAAQTIAPINEPDTTSSYGGRLEVETSTAATEGSEPSEAQVSHRATADVYFEGKPNKDFRGLVRLRFVDQSSIFSSGGAVAGSTGGGVQIDEANLRWDAQRTWFFTAGKQHLRWGAGKFWNPTDFLAPSVRDPFANFDRRLGAYLLKVHLPQEKQGFNHYLVVKLSDQPSDIEGQSVAIRSEFAFLGQGETSFTAEAGSAGSRLGWDVSAGIGPIDLYVEAAFLANRRLKIYEGKFVPESGLTPNLKDLSKDGFSQQVLAGLSWSFNYSDDDSMTVGGEYFQNGIGYEDGALELYAYLSGDAQQLYLGKRYSAGYLRLPNPWSFNKTTIMLSAIQNHSDKSASERLNVSYDLGTGAGFDLFASACQGSPGELCFAIRPDFKTQILAQPLPESSKAAVTVLPSAATTRQFGASFRISF